MRVPRTVMAVGGVVVAAAAIGFMDPKAVHAVTAALVQVTNTAANPVVTQSVEEQAAQLVELYCSISSSTCFQMLPGGQIVKAYTVPAGQTLVITDVDVTSGTTSPQLFGINAVVSGVSGSEPSIRYELSADSVTHHFSLNHGVAFPADTVLYPWGDPQMYVYLYGYVTDK